MSAMDTLKMITISHLMQMWYITLAITLIHSFTMVEVLYSTTTIIVWLDNIKELDMTTPLETTYKDQFTVNLIME